MTEKLTVIVTARDREMYEHGRAEARAECLRAAKQALTDVAYDELLMELSFSRSSTADERYADHDIGGCALHDGGRFCTCAYGREFCPLCGDSPCRVGHIRQVERGSKTFCVVHHRWEVGDVANPIHTPVEDPLAHKPPATHALLAYGNGWHAPNCVGTLSAANGCDCGLAELVVAIQDEAHEGGERAANERCQAFVREFVQWADDGEDDDGLVARARILLAAIS